jgi:hypothetical protein
LSTPLLSLIAGVPGNFIGFYLLGWLVEKRPTLGSFVLNNFIALMIGNLVAALGVLFYFWLLVPSQVFWLPGFEAAVVSSLTLYWLVTMIIFVMPLVPILIFYIEPVITRMGIMKISKFQWDNLVEIIRSTIIVSFFLLAIYFVVTYIPGAEQFFSMIPNELLLISSAVVFLCGIGFVVLSKNLFRLTSQTS